MGFTETLRLSLFFFCQCALFPSRTHATPSIALPINSQLPPVAQPGKEFRFQFSASTFGSLDGDTTYDLINAPAWLRLDGKTRELSGTPSGQDEGTRDFTLRSSDSSGSANMSVIIVVSDNPFPKLADNAHDQLTKIGAFQSPNTLLIYPNSPLNIGFGRNIFRDISPNTQYYAIGSDNTPLPSWVHFDANNLAFFGQTPIFTSPTELPQTFQISLIASDIPGFSQANLSFNIVVESHELTFSKARFIIDVLPDQKIEYSELGDSLLLDGKPTTLDNLTTISADQPRWLSFSHETLRLDGVAPKDVQSSNFTLTVTDSVGDAATAFISVQAPVGKNTTSLILGELDPVVVDIGAFFNYTFERSDFASGNISVAIDLGNASNWIHFDNCSLSLAGTPPADSRPQRDTLNLMASLGDLEQTQELILQLVQENDKPRDPSSTISLHATSTASGSPSVPSGGSSRTGATSDGSSSNKGKIAAAVVCPVLVVFFLVALVLLWHKKRRRMQRLTRTNRQSRLDKDGLGHREAGPAQQQRVVPSAAGLLSLPTFIQKRRKANKINDNISRPMATVDETQAPHARPPRPPSGAPQVGRFVLERDPDPFREFIESHELSREPSIRSAPGHTTLRSIDRPRSVSEPLRNSRLMRSLQDNNNEPQAQQRSSGAEGTDSWIDTTDSFDKSSSLGALEARGSTLDYSSSQCSDPSALCFSSSGPWHPPDRSLYSSSSCAERTAGPIAAAARGSRGRFRDKTVRGVTPSVSSASTPSSKEKSLTTNNTPTKRASERSVLSHRRNQQSSGSITKRKSSDLSLYLKQRRQRPQAARFSNSSTYGFPSSAANRYSRFCDSSEYTSTGSDLSNKENAQTDRLHDQFRKRSRASVGRLGRHVQSKMPFSERSISMKSSSSVVTSSSEMSLGAYERQLQETEELAQENKRYGSQRRSSWNRLSSLPEAQASNGAEWEFRLGENTAAKVEAKQPNVQPSTSFKGELGDWETDEELNSIGKEQDYGPVREKEEDSSKAFL